MNGTEKQPAGRLARFVADLDASSLPAEVRQTIGRHALDVIGGIVAGVGVGEAKPVQDWFVSTAPGDYPILTTRAHASLAAATAANAMLSHVAEADPVHAGTVTCIAAPVIPMVLTLAHQQRVSGAEVLCAIAAGYEVLARVGRLLGTARQFARGFWPTALCGGMGAAAAASRLLRLGPEETRSAIGLAALHATGLASGGAEAPLSRHVLCGNTARIGLEMALVAKQGIAGPPEPLTGDRSVVTAFAADDADPAVLTEGLGEHWAALETSIKAFACALQAQSALDALLSLQAEQAFAFADVTSIDVELPQAMMRVVDRHKVPATRLEALASIQFLFSAVMHDGGMRLGRFDAGARTEPEVCALMDKVKVRHAEAFDSRFPREWPARVTVRLSGTERDLVREVDVPPGHPSRPFTDDRVWEKFQLLTESRLSSSRAEEVRSMTRDLAALPDVGEIARRLDPEGPA